MFYILSSVSLAPTGLQVYRYMGNDLLYDMYMSILKYGASRFILGKPDWERQYVAILIQKMEHAMDCSEE